MRRTQKSPGWLPIAAMTALAVSSGCTATPTAPQATAVATANAATVPSHNGKFQIKEVNGKHFCTSCNTELNADGRHKMSNLLVRSLVFLRTGEVLKKELPKPGDLTLRDSILIGLNKLGMKKVLSNANDPYAQVNLMPDYVSTIPEAQAYVQANPTGCCIPDGQPAPDPPY